MELTIGYGRKLQPGTATYEHENEEAKIFFKVEVPDELGDVELAAIAEQARVLFAAAKIRVLSELGVEFESGEDGVIRELARTAAQVTTQIPGTTVVQGLAAPVAVAVPAAPPALAPVAAIAPPPAGIPAAPPPAAMSKGDLVQAFLADPSQWEDKRATATGQQPIFRHKTLNAPPNKEGKIYKVALWRNDFTEAGYAI